MDTLLLRIGPLVQKIWLFKVGRPPHFLEIFKKLPSHISETNHPINEKF